MLEPLHRHAAEDGAMRHGVQQRTVGSAIRYSWASLPGTSLSPAILSIERVHSFPRRRFLERRLGEDGIVLATERFAKHGLSRQA